MAIGFLIFCLVILNCNAWSETGDNTRGLSDDIWKDDETEISPIRK